MSATHEGNLKAAATKKLKYGSDFHAKIGSMGGKATNGRGGFGSKTIGKDGLTGLERAKIARWGKRSTDGNQEVSAE